MMTRDAACQILGLPSDHTFVDVKRAYRMAAQRWHPDRSGDQATASQFIAANEAYERLTRYRDLADRPATTATQPSYPPPPPRPYSTRRKKYEPWRYVVGTSTRRWRIGTWTVTCRTVIDQSEASTTVVRSIRRARIQVELPEDLANADPVLAIRNSACRTRGMQPHT
jgi:hypothetical protein